MVNIKTTIYISAGQDVVTFNNVGDLLTKMLSLFTATLVLTLISGFWA